MSLVNFQAATRLARQPLLLATWAQEGSREELLERFKAIKLENLIIHVQRCHKLFLGELTQNLKDLPENQRVSYLKALEGVFAKEQERRQFAAQTIKLISAQIAHEYQTSNEGIPGRLIAWRKIRNGLQINDQPLTNPERHALGILYTIATGSIGYVDDGIAQVKSQLAVLSHQTDEDSSSKGRTGYSDKPIEEFLMNKFTASRLDLLAYKCGLIMSVDDLTKSTESTPGRWVILIEVLREARFINTDNKKALSEAITKHYGRVVGLRSLQNGYSNGKADSDFYSLVKSMLSIP